MPTQAKKSIIVKGRPAQIFGLWADFENFPRFMKNVESVTKTGPRMSHWIVKGPLGRKFQWVAETTMLDENRRIGWSTKDFDGGLTTSGEVLFTELPHDQTEINVTFQYNPPAGIVGHAAAEILGEPDKDLEQDLRSFKRYAESISNHHPQ